MRKLRWLGAVALVASASVAVASGPSAAVGAGDVTITQATGGGGAPVIISSFFDLASVGYEQSEAIVSGTAAAYTATAPLGEDGRWSVAPSGDAADYTTRAVTYRPNDPARFNGTVVI